MSEEKQIEEMAKVCTDKCKECHNEECRKSTQSQHCIAENLYNAGYRKQIVGEWKMKVYPITSCSVCGILRSVEYQQGWNFCPNCGAKMKGGAE